MKNKITSLLILVSLALGISTFYFSSKYEQYHHDYTIADKELTELKSKYNKTEKKLDTSSKLYSDLYTEKNGQAIEELNSSINTFFKAYFTYDTAKKDESNAVRSELVKDIANKETIEEMFPLSKDGQTSDFGNVTSSLKEKPKVYIESSNDNQIKALVNCTFEAKAQGMDYGTSTYMYSVTYDQPKKEIISVKKIGKIDLD